MSATSNQLPNKVDLCSKPSIPAGLGSMEKSMNNEEFLRAAGRALAGYVGPFSTSGFGDSLISFVPGAFI